MKYQNLDDDNHENISLESNNTHSVRDDQGRNLKKVNNKSVTFSQNNPNNNLLTSSLQTRSLSPSDLNPIIPNNTTGFSQYTNANYKSAMTVDRSLFTRSNANQGFKYT